MPAEKVYENGENSVNSAGELRKLQGGCTPAFACPWCLSGCMPSARHGWSLGLASHACRHCPVCDGQGW